MNFYHKTWDTDFFGFNTGEINCIMSPSSVNPANVAGIEIGGGNSLNDSVLSNLIKDKFDIGYRLIYIYSEEAISPYLFEEFKPYMIKTSDRIIFHKSLCLCNLGTLAYDIEEYNGSPKYLYELAYIAGHKSRFYTDKLFPKDLFYSLYQKWIDNALNNSSGEKIFITRNNDIITGFITARIVDDRISVGLFAVRPEERKKGLGRKLLHAVISYGKMNNIDRLDIATQKENIDACNFYHAMGLTESKPIHIYHCWNKLYKD